MEEDRKEEKTEASSTAADQTKNKSSANRQSLSTNKKTTYGIGAVVIVLIALGSLFFVGEE